MGRLKLEIRAFFVGKLLAAIALACLVSAPIQAQTSYGSIVGTITDASAAAIANASITLLNNRTGDRRVTQSSSDGAYEFPNLPPGSYRVDVEAPGFKHLTRDNIEILVQATVRVDSSMQIGDVGQTVEVSSQVPLLQTDTSTLGTVVESRKVQEMPLNGRNVMNLVTLVPGVVAQGSSMTNPTGQNIFSFGNYQIGGGIAGQNATFYDGAPLNVAQGSLIALIPTQDATQEFRVQTNSLGPEFGRFAGGVINLVSKSGSNSFHGSGYEFLRNKVLNANTFFNNLSGKPVPSFTQNQYGANIGGPLKKDKTFFFFAWEGFRLRYGVPFLVAVPTAQQRLGDFSNTRSASGAILPIYDPLTNVVGANGQVTRSPFANNMIPVSRLDPTAKVLANYWGQPNAPGLQYTNVNNFSANAGAGGNNDQFNTRVDHNLSEKQRLFARYSYWTNYSLAEDPYGTHVYQDRGPETWIVNSAVVGDTYTLSPTTVLDIHAAFIRFKYGRTPATLGLDLTTFGLPAALNNAVSFRVIPTPVVQGFSDIWTSQGPGSVIRQANDSYSLYPVVTKIMGSHTLKLGGEVRRQITNYIQSNVGSGLYNFDNLFTAVNPQAAAGTGFGFASFMLGYGSSGNVVTPVPYSYRNYYAGVYINDSWQASRRLTLNLGVRWELPFPEVERYNRFSVLLPNAPSPFAAAAGLPNLIGRLGLVNSPDDPSRYAAATHLGLFAPRAGLAYRVNDKTVVRMGYGIFYVQNDGTGGSLTSVTQPWASTPDGEITPAATLSNPFPTGILQPPQRNANFQQLLLGTGVSAPIVGTAAEHFGYLQQWNFNLERQLMDGMALEVAYAGSKGTHLVGGPVINELADSYLSMGLAALQKQVPNPFYGIIPFGTLALPTIAQGQLLRPYPQYTQVTAANDGNRDSVYHSLQVKLEKRFHQGGSVLASYAWTKNISDIETGMGWLEAGPLAIIQNNNNLRAERAVSGFDVPHRLIVSYSYDLPIGKGQHFASGVTGPADKLISGWGINGISTFQSGFPLALSTSSNPLSSFGFGTLRPNYVGGCNPFEPGSSQQKRTEWFNTSCFANPTAGTTGNMGRTFTGIRTAGIANYDFSVFKSTTLTERFTLQFRAEIFNLFNRVQFGPPGEVFGNAQFGVVSTQLNLPRLIQFSMRLNY